MNEADHKAVLDAVEAEMRSAYTLIADPQCSTATAMPHLLRAWQSVAWLSRKAVPQDAGSDLRTWLSDEHLALIPQKRRGVVHGTLMSVCRHPRDPEPWTLPEAPPDPPAAEILLDHMRALGRVVEAMHMQHHGRTPATHLTLRWGKRAAVWGGLLTAFVLVALRPWQTEDVGPWRAAYYPTEKFEGRPDVRREVDVAFDWDKDPPTDSIPSDRFGARFDSCLVLDEDTEVTFQVVSDDGSKVYVDGEVVIDNWEKHRPTARGEKMELSAGVHHLRVDYFEYKHAASLHFVASFDDQEAPSPIPARMLEFPGMDFDEEGNPCEGVD